MDLELESLRTEAYTLAAAVGGDGQMEEAIHIGVAASLLPKILLERLVSMAKTPGGRARLGREIKTLLGSAPVSPPP